MEIERKFLVRSLPDHYETCPHASLTQGYVSRDPVIRFRKIESDKGVVYRKTMKGRGLAAREEHEWTISREEYEDMRSHVQGKIIEKTRYRIPLENGLTAELDIFHGTWEGLRIVEVEFPSLEEMNRFTPPDWFGEDVTLDGRYQNSRLSQS